MNDPNDPRPFDEILWEIIVRTKQLKEQAMIIQEERSITKTIIRWINSSTN